LETLDNWTYALDNNFCIDVVYFDFSKAFDTIPHDKLIDKLSLVGISGSLLSWIKNFLINRTFTVKVNDHSSLEKSILSGVSQGSVFARCFKYVQNSISHTLNASKFSVWNPLNPILSNLTSFIPTND
jgi:hypothetical protein